MSMREDWKRLNGRHRTRNLRKGLEARVADPLWMLTRQWQFGEFEGDDAATPAQALVRYKSLPVNQFQSRTMMPGDLLEPLAEREPVTEGPAAVRMSAEAGIQFLRRLPKDNQAVALTTLKNLYPLKARPGANQGKDKFLSLLLGRSFDAQAFVASSEARHRSAYRRGPRSSKLAECLQVLVDVLHEPILRTYEGRESLAEGQARIQIRRLFTTRRKPEGGPRRQGVSGRRIGLVPPRICPRPIPPVSIRRFPLRRSCG